MQFIPLRSSIAATSDIKLHLLQLLIIPSVSRRWFCIHPASTTLNTMFVSGRAGFNLLLIIICVTTVNVSNCAPQTNSNSGDRVWVVIDGHRMGLCPIREQGEEQFCFNRKTNMIEVYNLWHKQMIRAEPSQKCGEKGILQNGICKPIAVE